MIGHQISYPLYNKEACSSFVCFLQGLKALVSMSYLPLPESTVHEGHLLATAHCFWRTAWLGLMSQDASPLNLSNQTSSWLCGSSLCQYLVPLSAIPDEQGLSALKSGPQSAYAAPQSKALFSICD